MDPQYRYCRPIRRFTELDRDPYEHWVCVLFSAFFSSPFLTCDPDLGHVYFGCLWNARISQTVNPGLRRVLRASSLQRYTHSDVQPLEEKTTASSLEQGSPHSTLRPHPTCHVTWYETVRNHFGVCRPEFEDFPRDHCTGMLVKSSKRLLYPSKGGFRSFPVINGLPSWS